MLQVGPNFKIIMYKIRIRIVLGKIIAILVSNSSCRILH